MHLRFFLTPTNSAKKTIFLFKPRKPLHFFFLVLFSFLVASCTTPTNSNHSQKSLDIKSKQKPPVSSGQLQQIPQKKAKASQKQALQKLWLGRSALKKNQPNRAKTLFEEGLILDKKQGLLHLEWSNAAQILAVEQDLIEVHLRNAKTLLPNNPRVLFTFGFFLEAQGRYDEAKREYQNALQLRKEHLDARIRLAFLLLRKKQPSAALQHFLKAEHTAPHRLDVLAGLAQAAEQTADLKTTERILLKQVALHPKLAVRHKQLIAFYRRHAFSQKATRAQIRLDKLNPKKKRRFRKLRSSRSSKRKKNARTPIK